MRSLSLQTNGHVPSLVGLEDVTGPVHQDIYLAWFLFTLSTMVKGFGGGTASGGIGSGHLR